jgi:hypothetical protein
MPPNDDRNADFRKALRRLLIVIAIALIGTLALVWYLWEHSPKPP